MEELHGILPICSYCKRIRSSADSWQGIEEYVSAHSAACFSHGICPECLETVLESEMEPLQGELGEQEVMEEKKSEKPLIA